MNLYSYVGNDPVNFVDPWGECRLPGDRSDTIVICGPGRDNDPFDALDRVPYTGPARLRESTPEITPLAPRQPQRSEPKKAPEMSKSACTAAVGGVLIAGATELGTTALHVARSGYGLHAILAGASSVVTLNLVGIAGVSGAAVYVADRFTDGAISNFAGKQLGICQ